MTHSAAMAGEALVGKTLLEALNTDLVCDAINTAMRELFLQIAYGRSRRLRFPKAACPSAQVLRGTLAKGLRSQSAPSSTNKKGRSLSWSWQRAISSKDGSRRRRYDHGGLDSYVSAR